MQNKTFFFSWPDARWHTWTFVLSLYTVMCPITFSLNSTHHTRKQDPLPTRVSESATSRINNRWAHTGYFAKSLTKRIIVIHPWCGLTKRKHIKPKRRSKIMQVCKDVTENPPSKPTPTHLRGEHTKIQPTVNTQRS